MFGTSWSSILRTESVKGPVALITHLALTSNSCPVKENSINHVHHLFSCPLTLCIINLPMNLTYCKVYCLCLNSWNCFGIFFVNILKKIKKFLFNTRFERKPFAVKLFCLQRQGRRQGRSWAEICLPDERFQSQPIDSVNGIITVQHSILQYHLCLTEGFGCKAQSTLPKHWDLSEKSDRS